MRLGICVCLVAMLSACEAGSGQFDHQAALYTETRGVALQNDGESAVVGMFGTTCDVYTEDGAVGVDYEYSTVDQEMVTDIGPKGVLIVVGDSVHLQGGELIWDETTVPGLVDAGFAGDDMVTVADNGGCEVTWHLEDGLQSIGVDLTVCSGGQLAGAADGTAYVGTDDGVLSITPDDIVVVDAVANLVAWDESANVLYTAQADSSWVNALEIDGSNRWTVDVEGSIQAITALGDRSRAVISSLTADGAGELITIDGFTGEVLSVVSTPGGADAVNASSDGSMVSVTTPSALHFFKIRN